MVDRRVGRIFMMWAKQHHNATNKYNNNQTNTHTHSHTFYDSFFSIFFSFVVAFADDELFNCGLRVPLSLMASRTRVWARARLSQTWKTISLRDTFDKIANENTESFQKKKKLKVIVV